MQPTASSRKMVLEIESWPLARRFEIARGSKISAELVRVTLSENGFCGRGEAVPYRRYGESIETVSAAIETLQPQIEAGMTRAQLGEAILPGAARAPPLIARCGICRPSKAVKRFGNWPAWQGRKR